MEDVQDLLVEKQEELTGVVTLKSVFSKEQKLHVQPTKDPSTGWFHGVEQLSEDEKKERKYVVEPINVPEKNIKATKLTLKHGMSFNLKNPVDAINWSWIKHCPAVCMTFEEVQRTPGAIFYVENEEREALTSLSRMEKVHKAQSFVMNDDTNYLATRALLLGFNMQGEKPLVIKERLMKLASDTKTAQKVLDAYESSNISIQLIFIEAKNRGMIKVDQGVYLLNGKVIGMSQDSAIEFLKSPENRAMVLQLEKELHPENHPVKQKKEPVIEAEPEIEAISLEELEEEDEVVEPETKVTPKKTVAPKKRVVTKK